MIELDDDPYYTMVDKPIYSMSHNDLCKAIVRASEWLEKHPPPSKRVVDGRGTSRATARSDLLRFSNYYCRRFGHKYLTVKDLGDMKRAVY